MKGFLFGKLPSRGDFVCVGLSPRLRRWWDGWCVEMCYRPPTLQLEEAGTPDLLATPLRFVRDPEPGEAFWQMGCVVRSRDRVGRAFPLVFGISLQRSPTEWQAVVATSAFADRSSRMMAPSCSLEELVTSFEEVTNEVLGASSVSAPLDSRAVERLGGVAGTMEG